MERLNELVTPASFSEKLEDKLGKLWSNLDIRQTTGKNDEEKTIDEQWESVFNKVRQMLIRVSSEPDFPIDFNLGETSFSVYAKQMINIDPDGKLKKKIVRCGSGEVVPDSAVVYIYYRAYLQNEEYPFTSSYMHSSNPRRYQLGSGSLSSGFEAAMSTMKVGEKAHFILAPEIAFGNAGLPPVVPAGAEILLEVELCDKVCHEYKLLKGLANSSVEKFEYDKVLKTVNDLHRLGNEFYKSGNFTCAVINYRKAENLLTVIECTDTNEERCRKEIVLKMIINQIITYVTGNRTLKRTHEAVSTALRAFQHVPAEASVSTKLKYNLAKAFILLNEIDKAFQLITEAKKLNQSNLHVRNLYNTLEKQIKQKIDNETRCWEAAKKKFPEHSSKEEYLNFLRTSTQLDLENYLENPTSNMGMPWSYSPDERVMLGLQAEKMNLVYEEYKSHPANVLISIHKRGCAMLVTQRDEILNSVKEFVNSDDDDDEEDGFTGWDVEINEMEEEEEDKQEVQKHQLEKKQTEQQLREHCQMDLQQHVEENDDDQECQLMIHQKEIQQAQPKEYSIIEIKASRNQEQSSIIEAIHSTSKEHLIIEAIPLNQTQSPRKELSLIEPSSLIPKPLIIETISQKKAPRKEQSLKLLSSISPKPLIIETISLKKAPRREQSPKQPSSISPKPLIIETIGQKKAPRREQLLKQPSSISPKPLVIQTISQKQSFKEATPSTSQKHSIIEAIPSTSKHQPQQKSSTIKIQPATNQKKSPNQQRLQSIIEIIDVEQHNNKSPIIEIIDNDQNCPIIEIEDHIYSETPPRIDDLEDDIYLISSSEEDEIKEITTLDELRMFRFF